MVNGSVIALEVVDELASAHENELGGAAAGYLGHVRRVVSLTCAQIELSVHQAHLLGVAAFYHDSAIWLDGSFDYLEMSSDRAVGYLESTSPEDIELVRAMIVEHHRLRPARHQDPLVEAFRRSDLADLSFGLIPVRGAGLKAYRSLVSSYPAAGFRRGLAVEFFRWVKRHPLRPLPMVRW